jgi:hypothetical protein
MPTNAETIPNKALSGSELKRLILEDCIRMCANDTRLSDYAAYGRLSYMITITLNIDNPFSIGAPQSTTQPSRTIGKNLLKAMPELEAVEPHPLTNPSPEAETIQKQLTRTITSPNAERLRTGMAIPVEVKQRDGAVRSEEAHYPATGEVGDVVITET